MNTSEKSEAGLERLRTLSKSKAFGFIIVAIVAFSLGLLLSGGGDRESEPDTHIDGKTGSQKPTLWTCSMHPQIKLPKSGQCPICFMDLIPLETGAGDELDPRQIIMTETAKQLARIETVPVTRAFAEAKIRMVGKLAYDETEVAYITAWVPGRLDKLYADFTGIRVSKGDHLVYMYSPELLAAQEELLQANATVSALSDTKSTVLGATAAATVEAAREKLRLFGLTLEQIQDIESTGKTTDHLTIYAPIGGVIVHKTAKEGMYVETGTKIYTIADLSKLWVLLEAYESDLPWLRYGQHVEFSLQSFPGETFQAVISFIDPVVDSLMRTVRVRAVVDNSSQRLKPDMFVSGIVTSRLDNTGKVVDASRAISDGDAPLLIPATAPLLTGTRAVVYIELASEDGPLFEGREVQLGPKAGDFYVVKDGLEEGEMVVTNGAFKIDSELQIQAKPSMMYTDGGGGITGHDHGQPHAVEHEDMDMASEQMAVDIEAVESLSQVYDPYFELQMALANDDFDAAIAALTRVEKGVGSVDMSLFEGDAHMTWMNLSKTISEQSETGKTAESIEAARDAFYHVSKAVIELHDAFGHSSEQNYYLTFCPMARDNQGAFWLQTVDTVYNSFYGDMMLRCGEIKATLEPKN
jgi:Cu(I)/Ag(I) efflux system membrane fusion protein